MSDTRTALVIGGGIAGPVAAMALEAADLLNLAMSSRARISLCLREALRGENGPPSAYPRMGFARRLIDAAAPLPYMRASAQTGPLDDPSGIAWNAVPPRWRAPRRLLKNRPTAEIRIIRNPSMNVQKPSDRLRTARMSGI
jgi:hypothetical protein